MMLSGVDENDHDDSTAGLVDAYMTKPVMLQEFLSKVESVIAGKAMNVTQQIGAAA